MIADDVKASFAIGFGPIPFLLISEMVPAAVSVLCLISRCPTQDRPLQLRTF